MEATCRSALHTTKKNSALHTWGDLAAKPSKDDNEQHRIIMLLGKKPDQITAALTTTSE